MSVQATAPGPIPPRASSGRRRSPGLAFELLESKLRPLPARSGVVNRSGLVERLLDAREASVLAVVAPAGYGKSTLLEQWARHKQPRVAWLSADAEDNDLAVFLSYLAAAVDRVEPVDSRLFRMIASPNVGIGSVAPLLSAVDAAAEPMTLILDNAEAITDQRCRDVLAELALRLPPGSQLAIASRHDLPLPVARLRAQRSIVEVGADDLAMDVEEAGQLLAGAGIDLDQSAVGELRERTEGWPVGLYLAALAIKGGGTHTRAASGEDRFIGDYLRTELLSRVSRSDVSFLTRSSILEELSGPLCDATVGRAGSARALERLEARNLLVIPADHRRHRYRLHQLFRELLHEELKRREPEMVPELHRRAAAWYVANGEPEAAIRHAQEAGDVDMVESLFLKVANPVWSSGRIDTLMAWLEWFSDNGLVDGHSAVAVHGALLYALVGNAGEADRWTAAAERSEVTGELPDGNTMEGSVAYLRAILCRHGLDEMRRDAELALDGLSPTSPYRAAMLHAIGLSHLLQDDPEVADRFFDAALEEATSAGVVPFVPSLLVERGMVAFERGDWDTAEARADEALAVMRDADLADYWTSALVFAWAARLAASQGRLEVAGRLAARAARLRPLLTPVVPIVPVQALLELATAYVALGDAGGAHAALGQIREIARHRPQLGNLIPRAEALHSQLDLLDGELLGIAALTTAELRLLPFLPTHLSFADMGDRLYISRHTVKTQALSIYRKLGVSSRGEAVDHLASRGLRTPAP